MVTSTKIMNFKPSLKGSDYKKEKIRWGKLSEEKLNV